MKAREEILGRIRRANGDARAVVPIRREYETSGGLAAGSAEAVSLLEERLVDYKAAVIRCTAADLPEVIATELRDAATVIAPPGLDPAWLSATDAQHLTDDGAYDARRLNTVDAVVTASTIACARTGTIALDARPDQGRRILSLIPDRHICVVGTNQVVETVPELLRGLDATRPVTFISGPSATSDIELERIEGVHGPRDLRVVLLLHDL